VPAKINVWRAGKIVVCSQGASLPPRCTKCNEAADPPTKERQLYWVPPWVYILLFAGLLPLLVVYLIVRKKAIVNPGLCAKHKKRLALGVAIGWAAPTAGIGLLIVSGDQPALAVIGAILIVAGIGFAFAWARSVYARHIDDDEVRLGGFCDAYLDDLPQYPY
jgi:hypothetical protein